MIEWIRSKLIEDWKTAYKFWTINLQWLLIGLCAVYPYVTFLQQYAPGWWVTPIAILTIIARIISQKSANDS